MNQERAQDVPWKRLQICRVPPRSHLDSAVALYYDIYKYHISDYYVNPKSASRQAPRDWLDLLQGRTHNVHKVDVCALSLLRGCRRKGLLTAEDCLHHGEDEVLVDDAIVRGDGDDEDQGQGEHVGFHVSS